MSGPEEGVPIPQIPSGEEFEVSVTLRTPLEDGEEKMFGHRIWVDIMVDDKKGFMDEDWSFINGNRDLNESSMYSSAVEKVDDYIEYKGTLSESSNELGKDFEEDIT